MRSLPITQEFTQQYVDDLFTFFKKMQAASPKFNAIGESAQTCIARVLNQLDNARRRIKKNPSSDFSIDLSPNILMKIDEHLLRTHHDKQLYLSLGGCLSVERGELLSQSFCIMVLCKLDNDMTEGHAEILRSYPLSAGMHVLRKFHFDLDRTVGDHLPLRPLSHLQYGGKFSPEHICVDEVIQYQLFACLDNPRFPAIPYSFILCIDLALRSFSTDAQALTKERYWNEMIKADEIRWIEPFLRNTLEFINSGASRDTLWDFFAQKNTV